MNTELQVNLNKLKIDIKDAVFNAQPVRYNGVLIVLLVSQER